MSGIEASYRPSLDGVRAFCIIFTIINHIPNFPIPIAGSIGVDIFFSLSGWLITTLLCAEHKKSGRISLSAFYIRRIFRILPLYYLVLLIYGLAAVVRLYIEGSGEDFTSYVMAFPYIAAILPEYRHPNSGTIYGQAWTLGIEEKFYLIWPIMVVLFIKRPIYMALAASVFIVAISLSVRPDNATFLLRGYVGLAAGSALAITAWRTTILVPLLESQYTGPIALAAMIFCITLVSVVTKNVFINLAIGVVGSVLVASLWFNGRQPLAKILSNKHLVFVGTLTYGIYLTHIIVKVVIEQAFSAFGMPVTGLALFALTYAGSICVAWALQRTVENPLIAVGRRLSMREIQSRGR